MIDIYYDRKHNKVTVTGHAMSAEPGKDLICSAVSILVHTLGRCAEHISMDMMRFTKPTIEIAEGRAKIEINPNKAMKSLTTFTMDRICEGFHMLSEQYPENVHYEVKG